ncbi:hypothetical protein [Motiliproteus sp. MSK22-1]|uniref:hypothetical protein n=1 Tax=Motiliproteus sp. MSK22-1 TaxID=1897630 RepID=UPI000976FA82|nr:hypothetical protein [Motiliproteus sp. MSK22-1]OMH32122.1 hypothetical protein BGP75_15605 [Motiliproteus sp. MSK22-1]
MDSTTINGMLALAFGLGLVHALDADHIMAVSGLASRKPGFKSCLLFCRHWAVGHGLAITAIALMVFVFSAAIPEGVSELAESLVGVVLILIGGWTLWDIIRRKLKFNFHWHKVVSGSGYSIIRHGHWQDQSTRHNRSLQQGSAQQQAHSALLVGMLHGTAGSAPLLVLIPLSKFGSVTEALGYVLLFSLGVIVSMLIFGGLMGKAYQSLARLGERVIAFVRSLVALSAIGFGSHLLAGYF